jgi:peroxiredoxin family protein
MEAKPAEALVDELVRRRFEELLPQEVEKALARRREQSPGTMVLIATRGTLDWAYPPFILATTAAALGWSVSVFFTFYGLQLLRKDISHLKVSPLGNPAMPMKMPFGPPWFRAIDWKIPNAVQALVPGFESLASRFMKRTIRDKGVASVAELRAMAIEAGVNLVGCQMTVDLFGFTRDDFIPEVKEFVGAATVLPLARDADVSLFV